MGWFSSPKKEDIDKAKTSIETNRKLGIPNPEGGFDDAHQAALKQLLVSDNAAKTAAPGKPNDALDAEMKRRKLLGYKGN